MGVEAGRRVCGVGTRTYDGPREADLMSEQALMPTIASATAPTACDRASTPGPATSPPSDTRFGVFAAVDDGEVTRIRNIRYARAERFAPPVAGRARPARGIRPA